MIPVEKANQHSHQRVFGERPAAPRLHGRKTNGRHRLARSSFSRAEQFLKAVSSAALTLPPWMAVTTASPMKSRACVTFVIECGAALAGNLRRDAAGFPGTPDREPPSLRIQDQAELPEPQVHPAACSVATGSCGLGTARAATPPPSSSERRDRQAGGVGAIGGSLRQVPDAGPVGAAE